MNMLLPDDVARIEACMDRQKIMHIDNTPHIVNGHRAEPPKEPALLGVSLEMARGLAALFVFCFHIVPINRHRRDAQHLPKQFLFL